MRNNQEYDDALPDRRSLSQRVNVRIRSRTGLVVAAQFALACLGGCTGEDPESATTGSATAEATTKCDELLRSVHGRLNPARFGISNRLKRTATNMNRWLGDCAANLRLPNQDDKNAAGRLSAVWSEDALRRVQRDSFSQRDAEYVRTCLLQKTIADRLLKTGSTDLERVVNTFYYVVRTVALEQPDASRVPRSLFEVLLTGRGLAADRTWLFAGILRQMDIDTVAVLVPSGDAGEGDTDHVLAGVALSEGVYLFDPQAGLVVPSTDDDGAILPRRPATLKQLLAEPAVMDPLRTGAAPASVSTTDELSDIRVDVIGSSETWSDRMALLESAFAGDQAVVLYRVPFSAGEFKGDHRQINEALRKHWNVQSVGVWDYPEQQLTEFEHLDEAGQRDLEELLRPFEAPCVPDARKTMQSGSLEFSTPMRRQLKTRIDQLLGKPLSDVTQRYQSIRLNDLREEIPVRIGGQVNVVTVPFRIHDMNQRAREDALFWTAACQSDDSNHASAVDTLRTYLRVYKDGIWRDHARYLLGVSLAETGDFAEAARAIADVCSPLVPQGLGNALLQKRWAGVADQPDSHGK